MQHPEDDLITAKMACQLIGGRSTPINLATFYRGISAGRYPPGIPIGAQGKRWKRSELVAVIERAAAERRFIRAEKMEGQTHSIGVRRDVR
jgi:predicted DNA-binding transcriptional regulator AlpA